MRSAASRAPTAVVPISGTRAGEPSQRHVDILARTKLRPPRLSDRLVDRGPRLDTLEKTVANTAVTLLVAPAGRE